MNPPEPARDDRPAKRSRSVRGGTGTQTVQVLVVSLEESEHGVAEFWVDGEQLGQTLLREGQVVLDIIPRRDRRPWSVPARDLHDALGQARRLLEGTPASSGQSEPE